MASLNILFTPIYKLANRRKQKQQKIFEYQSLLNVMSSTGTTIYNGISYESIADFTIAFFQERKEVTGEA